VITNCTLGDLDGVHSQLVITSGGFIDNLVLLGCIVPVVTFTWSVSIQNNITGVVTCPGRTVHVTWSQAWRFRRLMTPEFRTEVYLLTGDELRVVRSEGGIEEQAVDGPVEYAPVHSPRGGSAMGGVYFFVPAVSRLGSISPLAESRPTSLVATVGRALSPPTRLPIVLAAEVHSPMGGGGL